MKNRPSTQSASLSLPTHKSQENYDLRLMSLRENRPFFKNCRTVTSHRGLYTRSCVARLGLLSLVSSARSRSLGCAVYGYVGRDRVSDREMRGGLVWCSELESPALANGGPTGRLARQRLNLLLECVCTRDRDTRRVRSMRSSGDVAMAAHNKGAGCWSAYSRLRPASHRRPSRRGTS